MCYSKGYKYSDGDIQSFSTALSVQLASCNTSRAMKGGKRKTKRNKSKTKSYKSKTKRNKRKRKRKNITLY